MAGYKSFINEFYCRLAGIESEIGVKMIWTIRWLCVSKPAWRVQLLETESLFLHSVLSTIQGVSTLFLYRSPQS